MGLRTLVVCDLQHDAETPATDAVDWSIGSTEYHLDLCAEHAEKVSKDLAALADLVPASQRSRSGGPSRRRRGQTIAADPTAVRKWAEANGIKVSPRGRIAESVVAQFSAANGSR